MQSTKHFVIKIAAINDISCFCFINETFKVITIVFLGIGNDKAFRILIVLVEITEIQMQFEAGFSFSELRP